MSSENTCRTCGRVIKRNGRRWEHAGPQMSKVGDKHWGDKDHKVVPNDAPLTADEKRSLEALKADRELLGLFGARLVGHDPGVTANYRDGVQGDGYAGEQLSFNNLEWAWLRPLLVELRDRRDGQKQTVSLGEHTVRCTTYETGGGRSERTKQVSAVAIIEPDKLEKLVRRAARSKSGEAGICNRAVVVRTKELSSNE
jgi:hypothetical protein